MAKRSGSGAGGGIRSNQKREVGTRDGTRAREMRPGGVAQFGSSVGNHITERRGTVDGAAEEVRGQFKRASISPPLGNEVAKMLGAVALALAERSTANQDRNAKLDRQIRGLAASPIQKASGPINEEK